MSRNEEDKELKCIDCGDTFLFTVGEQRYFRERNFTDPKRCSNCRRAKKEQKAREVVDGRR